MLDTTKLRREAWRRGRSQPRSHPRHLLIVSSGPRSIRMPTTRLVLASSSSTTAGSGVASYLTLRSNLTTSVPPTTASSAPTASTTSRLASSSSPLAASVRLVTITTALAFCSSRPQVVLGRCERMSTQDRLLVRVPIEHHPPSFQLCIVHFRQVFQLFPCVRTSCLRIAVKYSGVGEVCQFKLGLLVHVVRLPVGSFAWLE